MKIAFRGNHQPDLPDGVTPWSTETHVAGSLEQLGHEVVRVHEQTDDWQETIRKAQGADLFLWTQTWPFAEKWGHDEAAKAVAVLSEMMPTVGYHLDRWWGLQREWQIDESPFFRLDWLFTADGDHDEQWERAGIRHHFWMPPAVFGPECYRADPNPEWASDVAFIGSWEGYSHPEHWPHRKAMLEAARDAFGDRVQFWPRPGHGAVRGENLNSLLASVKVVVGDSCGAATSRRYWSDRCAEVVGRGGFIVHPWIEGLAERMPEGSGVAYFPPGDFAAMREVIEHYIAHDDEREAAIEKGMAHVLASETYAYRLAAALDIMRAEGAWS